MKAPSPEPKVAVQVITRADGSEVSVPLTRRYRDRRKQRGARVTGLTIDPRRFKVCTAGHSNRPDLKRCDHCGARLGGTVMDLTEVDQ
jgi:hypothetical protein